MSKAGWSDASPIKQEHFRIVLQTHLNIVQAIFKKYPYIPSTFYYFDTHCGPGIYEGGESGSPFIFLEEINKTDLRFSAIFIDENEEYIENLRREVGTCKNIKILHGNNAELLPIYALPGRKKRYGLLYSDPNGIFDDNMLSQFSRQTPHRTVDILINCPATTVKRVKNSTRHQETRTLNERLQPIDKKFLLVREALSGCQQWTFLLLTGWYAFPKFKNIRMFHDSDPEGIDILRKLNYTTKERKSASQFDMFKKKENF